MRIKQFSENALTIYLADEIDPAINRQLVGLQQEIQGLGIDGLMETVVSYTSLIVYFDSLSTDMAELKARIEAIDLSQYLEKTAAYQLVEIPVCYGASYGPDIESFQTSHGLSVEEVIDLHANQEYLVYMIGFMPGFPYLGGLNPKLHKARLETPRTEIPAGSVGIGGQQTGMYPFSSPGGWNLLGQTPVRIYDPRRGSKAILYQPGDRIVFRPIDEQTFLAIQAEVEAGTYEVKIQQRGGQT